MKEKPTVIAVVNQKGGTAKTTTVENLGIGLAREGKKVLLVDTDPQGSLTISLGYPRPDELEITLFDLLNKTINEDSVSAGEGILHQAEGIDLIPANISLAGLEVALVNTMNRERILKQFLEPVKGNYDYVLLDCMPSLGMLTVNALAAADAALVPVQANYLSASQRTGTAASDHQQGQAADQSEAEDRRNPADDGGWQDELRQGDLFPHTGYLRWTYQNLQFRDSQIRQGGGD